MRGRRNREIGGGEKGGMGGRVRERGRGGMWMKEGGEVGVVGGGEGGGGKFMRVRGGWGEMGDGEVEGWEV